jgi:hypothetical protein
MIARVLAAFALVVAFVAGCTSTVVLGSVGVGFDAGNGIDITAYRPLDMTDGGGLSVDLASPDGFDIGFASDAAPLVDLAQ